MTAQPFQAEGKPVDLIHFVRGDCGYDAEGLWNDRGAMIPAENLCPSAVPCKIA